MTRAGLEMPCFNQEKGLKGMERTTYQVERKGRRRTNFCAFDEV